MIPMFCACPPQIADLQTEIERKKLDIDEYSDRIAQLGHKEQSAREEVEAQRSGLQGVNVEIQRCMASLGDLGQEDKSAELKQHVAEKEVGLFKECSSDARTISSKLPRCSKPWTKGRPKWSSSRKR